MKDYTNLLVDDYYNWLLEMIDGGPLCVEDYGFVLEKLFHTQFYSIISEDGNRIADGFDMRYEYADLLGEHIYYIADQLPDYCTILEMMIALARRWDSDVMYDPEYGNRTADWFWMMFTNLGLDLYSDENFDVGEVSEILKNFVDRRYCKDGVGGLFWTKNAQIDMRNLEIWYQINQFFIEHPELEC